MSNLEHLMENALCDHEKAKNGEMEYEEAKQSFISWPPNIEMAEMENIRLDAVWQMAYYIMYTWCECCDYKE